MSELTEKYFKDKIDLLFPIFRSNQSYVDLIMREQVLCILGQIAFDQREACYNAVSAITDSKPMRLKQDCLDAIRNAEIK